MLKHLLPYKLAAYFLIALSSLFSISEAVEVEDLYVVTSPVKDQSKNALLSVSLSGLKQVLIRNSGTNAILNDKSVQKAYRKVKNYLQRFEYSKQDEVDLSTPYIVTLYFEPRLINELIQGAQMSLWGSSRPLTALWLVVEENNERKVIKELSNDYSSDNHSPPGNLLAEDLSKQTASKTMFLNQAPSNIKSTEKIILDNAQRRGIPVLLPLMDLEDQLLVTMSDIWGVFSSSIELASTRYSADSSLFGRIRQDGVLWIGKFGFINQKSEVNFELNNESKEQLIVDMINKLTELLCDKYCVVEEYGEKNEMYLDINNIHSFKRFKLVESYLSSLSSVRQSELIKIDKTHIKLKITLLGKVSSLIDDINLSQKMLLVEERVKEETDNQLALKKENVELENQELINNEVRNFNINELENKALESENLTNDLIEKTMLTLYYRWIG
jgi:hypothetical protein